ncbi:MULTISPECIES: acyl-CoA dehydrogenase family protein [Frankia]|uniref:Acyl-CoA dehydrogenase n=1 Tax=Frankia alni (strain DSM 45986 / CECT 9034 / ACN14a) TaxID=326424 RepID=Q0RQE9_FRAAA|nr:MULTISPECIES: acyl-CoA dehydrogenase family protein [Frankia]CAJ60227.1 Putative acyl-CoA dehydrogenase [Frankia alni ACN14a]
MYFALTDEQRALAETVRAFLADRFDLRAVRAVVDDEQGDGHPADLWRAIGEQGWLSVCVPAVHGGLDLGLLDAQVIVREFGAGVVPGPWAATVLAGAAIRRDGSPEQAAAVLGPLGAGELVATVALRGPGGHLGRGGIAVRADAAGRLDGAASGVEYAHVADVIVVAAIEPGVSAELGVSAEPEGPTGAGHGDGGVGLYLLERGAAGVRVDRQASIDATTRLAAVTLTGAPAARLPGSDAAGLADLLRRGAVLAAADLAGVARAALTRTVAYDTARVQFGRPVGSFQALAHHLADLHVAVTMAEHAVLYAAHALDEGAPDADLAVAVAKSKANQAAVDATAAMVQYHGGIGYTWEHDTHFFYKRAKRLAAAFGDSRQHLEHLARLTVDTVE